MSVKNIDVSADSVIDVDEMKSEVLYQSLFNDEERVILDHKFTYRDKEIDEIDELIPQRFEKGDYVVSTYDDENFIINANGVSYYEQLDGSLFIIQESNIEINELYPPHGKKYEYKRVYVGESVKTNIKKNNLYREHLEFAHRYDEPTFYDPHQNRTNDKNTELLHRDEPCPMCESKKFMLSELIDIKTFVECMVCGYEPKYDSEQLNRG